MKKHPLSRYQGDGKPLTGKPPRPHPYLAEPKLAKAVNMAIVLGRPLLIKGPPGCGKTRLADSIAHELRLAEPLCWYVKSTSRARDGLYTIDMVRRLCDAQLSQGRSPGTGAADARLLAPYLRFGPLGHAIRGQQERVLLIDEIDKADLDFPNDLLRELDELKFTIDELDPAEAAQSGARLTRDYSAADGVRPIIIITSNDEKELPEPFLRRCLFYYIPFPEPATLLEIVKVNLGDLKLTDHLVARATERFSEIRQRPPAWRKLPGTTELIDWLRILHHWGISPERLKPVAKVADLPEWEVLFKHQQDVERARHETLAAAKP